MENSARMLWDGFLGKLWELQLSFCYLQITYLFDFWFRSKFLLSQYPEQGASSIWKQGS